MRQLWCLEVEKIGEKISYGISNFFFLKTNGGKRRYLKGRERRFPANKNRPSQPRGRVGRVCHTGPEGWLARVAHGLHTGWPRLGLWPRLLLSRTSHVLRPYSGLQTPISNLFLDYESWLPHAQQRLWNFDKWLRIHLGKWRRTQLNEWERKVA